ncbi:hypothetical protein C8J57DRAFT_1341667 [Mycena rebaudengoi]|nr:hypothetical protein C8J57DRAFT_1341667 [Mycena rebaudengoi]
MCAIHILKLRIPEPRIDGDARSVHSSSPTHHPAAMDEWQFSQAYWDGSSEAQRRSTPAAGVLPSFGYPTDSDFSSVAAILSINHAAFCHPTPLLFSNLFTGAPQPAFQSDFSLPCLQPSETVYDPLVQPHWNDFVSSLYSPQPAPARPPSTGSSAGDFFNGGYSINILMADTVL